MSKIKAKFDELKAKNEKALITFITMGDPSIDFTKRVAIEMQKNGTDLIEFGIPFSDPIAEGPVIRKASERALKNNITIRDMMVAAAEIGNTVTIPMVFMLYYNCILKYGVPRFFDDCKNSGISGLIIPDLPYEERDEIDMISNKYPIDVISLVSPTSKRRIEKITKEAKGFLYCVSSLGVTGLRSNFETDFEEFFNEIDKYAKIPTAIGFGISTPDHIRNLKKYSDGLIVGSAFVKIVEQYGGTQETIDRIGKLVRELKDAL